MNPHNQQVSTTPSLQLSGIMKSEVLKLKALRTVAVSVPLALLTMALGGPLLAKLSQGPGNNPADAYGSLNGVSSAGSFPAGLLLAIAAISLVCNEFGTGTINISLLAIPGRGRLFLAKASLASGVTWAVTTVGITLAAFLTLLVAPADVVFDLFRHTTYLVNGLAALTSIVTLVWLALSLAHFLRTSGLTMGVLLAGLLGPFLMMPLLNGLGMGLVSTALAYTPGPLMNFAQLIGSATGDQVDVGVTPVLAVVLLWCWGVAALATSYCLLRKGDR